MSAEEQIYGPPQETMFDKLSPERRAQFDKALAIADGVKMYQAAGGMGIGAQWKPYAIELFRRGGLKAQEALNLARYRMWKQGLPVANGEAQPELTAEQKSARAKEFIEGDAKKRAALMAEDKAMITRSHETYFDNLVQKEEKKPEQKDEHVDTKTGLRDDVVYPGPGGSMPPKDVEPAELKAVGDLQLPPENVDPKTGLREDAIYPGPGGSLPTNPGNQVQPPGDLQLDPNVDPKTGLRYDTVYPSPDGTVPKGG